MSVDEVHMPHVKIRILLEVGAIVSLFGLALACMACSLNSTPGNDRRSNLRRFWRKLKCKLSFGRSESDEESYMEEETTRPGPRYFESLQEFVFFEAPESDDEDGNGAGFLATPIRSSRNGSESDDDEESRVWTTTVMEELFPDLLGGHSGMASDGTPGRSDVDDSNDGDLREPLL